MPYISSVLDLYEKDMDNVRNDGFRNEVSHVYALSATGEVKNRLIPNLYVTDRDIWNTLNIIR